MNPHKMSISLQDVTIINESTDAGTNSFNSNISLSLSDLSHPLNLKSKKTNSLISKFPNNREYLSLNTYQTIRNINSKKFKHVQSKVKDYIKQIKITNDQHKLQVRSVPSSPLSNDDDNSLPDIEILLNTISALKDELYKKDELINKLQESNNNLLKKHNESKTRIDRLRFESIENLSSRTPRFLSSDTFSPLLTNKFSSISDNNLNIMNKKMQRRSNNDFLPFELNKYNNQEEMDDEIESMNSSFIKFSSYNEANGNDSKLINPRSENKSVQTENPIESNTTSKV